MVHGLASVITKRVGCYSDCANSLAKGRVLFEQGTFWGIPDAYVLT